MFGEPPNIYGTVPFVSDELELLRRWRDGDKAAGETLVRAHYREIFERLRRELRGNTDLAAELTQQVFEVAVTKRDDIVTEFKRYLHGTARFKLWEHHRRRAKTSDESDAHPSQMIDPGHGVFSVMSKRDDARLLVEALRSLSVDEQAYMMWSYADKLTHAQIAERVGMNAAQIRGRIHRAREKLRQTLDALSHSPAQKGSIDKGFQTWMHSLRRRIDDEQ